MKTATISYNKELEEITIKLCGRQIWNEAIDAAINEMEKYCRLTKNNSDETTVAYCIDQIRKLKK